MTDSSTVAVTGAGGLIGTALVAALRADGRTVVPLVRRQARPGEARWDPVAGTVDTAALEGVGAVVHLAGESVGRRWTPARRQGILESRRRGTEALAEALAGMAQPPRVMVSSSASGYYGDRGDEELPEHAPPGTGFLAEVCQEWEAAADPARKAGIRVVHPRTGIVLAAHGGALKRMLTPFRMGLGGPVGSGRQWWSWIHLEDMVGIIMHAVGCDRLEGPVNAAAPESVRCRGFTKELGRVLHRPALFPLPSPVVRLMFGEMGEETILASQRMDTSRLRQSGFAWRHPSLAGALEDAVKGGARAATA